jgi:DNA-binding LytR/AlgR family response regulator
MKKEHLHISDKETHYSVEFSKIKRLSARRSSCVVHREDGDDILIGKPMCDVRKELGDTFIQIHRSHIVNAEKIKVYHKPEKKVELKCGERLPVSKGFRTDFIARYSAI